MLTQMRAISQNWIGRVILGGVLVVTIVGFVFWGSTTRGGGFASNDLAKIGEAHITAEQYRDAYQRQLSQIMEKQKRQISSEEANRLGLNVNVFGTLLSRAALTAEAYKLGLSVSNDEIARVIAADGRFKDRFGQFDQSRFAMFLANTGMSEASYAREFRQIMLQQDVSDAVTTGLDTPSIMTDAFHRYVDEVRDLRFFVLPPSSVGTVPAPTEADVKKYYDDRATMFIAPEYRALTVVSVIPANLVKPDAISDAEAKARYDAMKAQLYSVPEKRALQALDYPDAKAAAAAKAMLDHGATFETLMAEQNKTPTDVGLGTLGKDQINSPTVADAAFALPAGGTSAPLVGPSGPILVHVAKIEPGHDQPLMEVQAEIKDQIAIIRADAEAAKIRDRIEDARQSGKTLTQAAAAAGVKPRTIPAVDAQGYDKAHKPIEALADGPAVLKAAFTTDVGGDTYPISTSNKGYVWYEVDGIEASHRRPLAEVKGEVESDWRNDEIARRLAAQSDTLVKAITDGKSLADVAASAGKLAVMQGRNISRMGAPNLPSVVASAFFDQPVGKAGSTTDGGRGRIVFRIEAARVPAADPKNEDFAKLMEKVRGGFEENVLGQFVKQVEQDVGTTFNQDALKQTVLGNDAGS